MVIRNHGSGVHHRRRRVPRFVPDKLLRLLQQHIPGFRQERYGFEIAWMLWEATNPRSRHRYYTNAISLSHSQLRSMFGQEGFRQINRYPLMRYFIPLIPRNALSTKDSFTKGYQPAAWMQKALDWTIKTPGMIEMVDRNGKAQRIESNAIKSTDTQGHRVRRWKKVFMPSLIRVNCEALRASVVTWQTLHELSKQRYFDPARLNSLDLKPLSLPLALQQTLIFLALAENAKHKGCLPIQYQLHESGRLYAPGLNLQSCKRRVRQVALAGNWDADISACHFAIMAQMARQIGVDCPAINQYVDQKKNYRLSISEALNIPVYTVKKLINALGYGARATTSPRAAIAAEIGSEGAERFFSQALVDALKRDVFTVTKAIIQCAPRQNGCIVNHANRLARDNTRSAASLMAHLLQGVEAAALEAAVRICADRVVLLQHDGFTATQFVEPATLRQAVLRDTGFDLSFEVEQIVSPMQTIAARLCTKSEIDQKLNKYKDLESFWPVSLSTLVACTPDDVPPVYPGPLTLDESPSW